MDEIGRQAYRQGRVGQAQAGTRRQTEQLLTSLLVC